MSYRKKKLPKRINKEKNLLAKTRVLLKFGVKVFKKHNPTKGREGKSGTPFVSHY